MHDGFLNHATTASDVNNAHHMPDVPLGRSWNLVVGRLDAMMGVAKRTWRLAAVVATGNDPHSWTVSLQGGRADGLPLAMTMGRHTACPVRLPAGSLRQMTILGFTGEEPRLMAVDLNTPTRGTTVHLRASGRHPPISLVIAVGGALVFCVLLPPGERALNVPEPSVATRPYSAGSGSSSSTLTIRPNVGRLATWMRDAWAWFNRPAPPVMGGGSAWEPVRVKRGELVQGVLLGRDGRCSCSHAARLDGAASRVHAMLVSHGERIFLVDLASTNGCALVRVGRVTPLSVQRPVAEWFPGEVVRLSAGVHLPVEVG